MCKAHPAVRGVLSLALAVALVAGLEGVVRLARGPAHLKPASGDSEWIRYSARLGWRHRQTVGPVEHRPGTRVVLLLGDSRTFGNGVDPTETYGALLEHRLPGFRVINRAVPGYSSLQGRLVLEEDAPRVRPHAVVFAFGFNDRRYALRRGDVDGTSRFRRLFLGSLWTRLSSTLALVDMFGARRSTLEGDLAHPLDLSMVVPRVSPEAFRQNLEAVARQSSEHGSRLIVLLLSDNPAQSRDLVEGVYALRSGRFDQALRALTSAVERDNAFSDAARLQLAVLYERLGRFDEARSARVSPRTFHSVTGGYPLAPAEDYAAIMRQVADASRVSLVDAGSLLDGHPEMFFDFCHFNRDAHRLIADLLARDLTRAASPRQAADFRRPRSLARTKRHFGGGSPRVQSGKMAVETMTSRKKRRNSRMTRSGIRSASPGSQSVVQFPIGRITMRRLTIFALSAALVTLTAALTEAQVGCPAEIGHAKELLSSKGGLRAEESTQPPRSLAGARKETETIAGTQWTGKLVRASRLVREAEAACKAGDMNMAREKAEAALIELK